MTCYECEEQCMNLMVYEHMDRKFIICREYGDRILIDDMKTAEEFFNE